MNKITIKLESEQIDAIVRKDLKNITECLEQDMYNASIGKGYHHPDDVAKYPKDIKAIKRVLKIYGE